MGNMGDAGEGAYTILKVTILACRGMYRSWRASRTGKVDPRGTFTLTPLPCPTPLKPPPPLWTHLSLTSLAFPSEIYAGICRAKTANVCHSSAGMHVL